MYIDIQITNKMGLSYEKKNHPSYRTRCYRIEFLRVVDTN